MHEADLAEIETKLGITLPKEYRRIMVERDADLWAARDRIDSIFLEHDDVVRANRLENQEGSGTEEAVPGWAKKYVLIGTDGAGGYYCLRLKRSRKVWMIGSDCDNEEEQAPNFAAFVEAQIGPLTSAKAPNFPAADAAKPTVTLGSEIAITVEVKSLRYYLGSGKSEKMKTEDSAGIKIAYADQGRSLKMNELDAAGVDVAELARRAVQTIALVAKNDPKAYKIDPAPCVKAGSVTVRFDAPPILFGNEGSRRLKVNVIPRKDGALGGVLRVIIADGAHKTKAPPPEKVGIDWEALQLAGTRMIQLLHGGKQVIVSGLRAFQPGNVDPTVCWHYLFDFAVT
jgi:hypothetical protein